MKNIIIICFILFSKFSFAQNFPILSTTSLQNTSLPSEHLKNGNYAIDSGNTRNQYVGTWEYNQDGILFQLRIFKKDQVLEKREYGGQVEKYYYQDIVILKYKLVKNGVLIFNNLNENSYNTDESYGSKEGDYDLDGFILDQTRNVQGYYQINRIMSSPAKIKFILLLGNYRMLNNQSYYNDGQPLFSIPTGGIEMVKID